MNEKKLSERKYGGQTLGELRRAVADNMADAAVGPLLEELDQALDRIAELDVELERVCEERDEQEAEHLRVAGMLADVVDALHGERHCEDHGYGDPAGDVNDLHRQLQQTQADYGTADHERRELLEWAREAKTRAAEQDADIERLKIVARRWRAMFESAGRLVGDMVEMHD